MAYMAKHRKPARDQFYMFLGLDGQIWSEIFLAEGLHMVAPTPFRDMELALAGCGDRNPGATVDELVDATEITQARKWAIECPLEQILEPA
jgi:hypothetical protein